MLDTQSLEWLMARERLKDQAATLEQQAETILACFDRLEREPTAAERDARREAYLENRALLHELQSEIDAIGRRVGAAH